MRSGFMGPNRHKKAVEFASAAFGSGSALLSLACEWQRLRASRAVVKQLVGGALRRRRAWSEVDGDDASTRRFERCIDVVSARRAVVVAVREVGAVCAHKPSSCEVHVAGPNVGDRHL